MSVYEIFASQRNEFLSDSDHDDPRRPLLGEPENRYRRIANKLCGLKSWRRRLPIVIWLRKYSFKCLFSDLIAGITVGLTSIPQGIAYALLAGLPPQIGLYSSIFPVYMYVLLGSSKDVTVGPTAVLATLSAKYVAVSVDFAFLMSFLSGCVILLLGILQLGFLLDFISKPVIVGFTSAAALQIGAFQLKSLFRIAGKSGHTFISAVINFCSNISTVQPWDAALGVATIVVLLVLKSLKVPASPGRPSLRRVLSSLATASLRARNALVVFAGMLLAYVLYLYGKTPLGLTGTITGGLPPFSLPPFSTTAGNRTLSFNDMLSVIGPEGFVFPLVSILESIAIAKAFAGGAPVDATQEMLALGASNVAGSLTSCMPVTGSFTRTALNHACGVMTPAGTFFMASLVLLTVLFMAPAFYFIPRASLAAVIMVAMVPLFDYPVVVQLWRNSKVELAVYSLVVAIGTCVALEYGIMVGALCDLARAAIHSARPTLPASYVKIGNKHCLIITLVGPLMYSCAEHIPREMKDKVRSRTNVVVLDAARVSTIDVGVAENLVSAVLHLEKKGLKMMLWNFTEKQQKLFADLHAGILSRFVCGPSIDQHILNYAEEDITQGTS